MSLLFSAFSIQGIAFSNRIVMAPMVRERGDDAGCITDALIEQYGLRADAGTGLIIVEATAVEQAGHCWKGGLGAYADSHAAGLARLAQRIRSAGAVAGIQLVHGGPQAEPKYSGYPTVGPSAVRPKRTASEPLPLALEEIAAIQEHFAAAAQRAVQAGFQLIEIHGAHGYLLDSFLSARRNLRQDAYGGSLENRMRMTQETCKQVRRRIGDSALLGCRFSLFNEFAEGFSPADLAVLVHGLQESGLDLLHLSTDGIFKRAFDTDRCLPAYVRELTTLPLIVCGGIRKPDGAEKVLSRGLADFVAVGKAMLNKADWSRYAHNVLERPNGHRQPTKERPDDA